MSSRLTNGKRNKMYVSLLHFCWAQTHDVFSLLQNLHRELLSASMPDEPVELRVEKLLKKASEEGISQLSARNIQHDYSPIPTDEMAATLLPEDAGNVRPVSTYGDGNCLPYALSLAAFGHPHNNLHIRVNLAIELMKNVKFYASHSLVQYCEAYEFGKKLNNEYVQQCIFNEALSGLQNHAYMGIFHIWASAEVLGCSIKSVYPTYGANNVRADLNRIFCPRSRAAHSIISIMWTNTTGKHICPALWAPNHFVPLVEIKQSQKVNKGDNIERKSQSEEQTIEIQEDPKETEQQGTSVISQAQENMNDPILMERATCKRKREDGENDMESRIETLVSENQSMVSVALHDYVAVYFTRKPYIGKIISCNTDSSMKIKFLEQTSSSTFKWPKRDDIVDKIEAVRVFAGPLEITGNHNFTIPDTCMSNVQKLHKQMKHIIG